ncbi:MAG: hypothetical protein K6E19_04200 [Lachnospiraceae bacterium]|nr:hypothetical protein [Lachnospiraceae bacterium]
MKKTILKIITSLIVFAAALFLSGLIMNRGNVNTTSPMERAKLPVVYMTLAGERINELYGYTSDMDVGLLRENITPLDDSRGVTFGIAKYGQSVKEITVKVRTTDGSRLIENFTVTDYTEDDYTILASITFKDLIEEYKEYSLQIILGFGNGKSAMYHTKIIQAPEYCPAEKLAFARNFWEKEASTETNGELKYYMESNYLGDNSSLAYVNIHSSMKQLAFAGLPIKRETPYFNICELAKETGIFTVEYIASLNTDEGLRRYFVREYYRIKYSPEVTYLLDYERTMTQVPDEKNGLIRKEDILLGITPNETGLKESDDGNVIAFTAGNCLYSYNISENRIARLFSFYDENNFDERTYRNASRIKALSVDEAGNVYFLVYGYMNRGRYEGRVGLALYHYNGVINVVDEIFFIASGESPEMVERDLRELAFLSRDGILYFMLDKTIYDVNIETGESEILVRDLKEYKYTVSDNSSMMVWQEGDDVNACESLKLMNLNTKQITDITAPAGQFVKPLVFMGEDLVYGLARRDDVVTDNTGRTTFPMYMLRMQSKYGEILKEYEYGKEEIYVTDVSATDNLLTLSRVKRTEKGFADTESDYITNNQKMEETVNTVNLYSSTEYGNMVRILLMKSPKGKNIILTPNQVIIEGLREISIENPGNSGRYYYVYYKGNLANIYTNPANAVREADSNYGDVVNTKGYYVWYRANRSLRNQIMNLSVSEVADKEKEEVNQLAVCLDMISEYEGGVRNSEYLLSKGNTIMSIMESSLTDMDVVNLTGCTMDSVLYYVNRDIPVLALTHTEDTYLILGFNQLAVVVYNPLKGTYKIGRNEAEKLFYENGNQFITYVPNK